MKEQLSYRVPALSIITDEHTSNLNKPIGIYCKTINLKLVLPPGVSYEKYSYIQDSFLGGAYEILSPERRNLLLTYFATGHSYASLGRTVDRTRATIEENIKRDLAKVWEETSNNVKADHPKSIALEIKGRHVKRKGKPFSDDQKRLVSQLNKNYMTEDERNKRREGTRAQMSNPKAKDNLSRILILRGMENRAKLAITNPQKAKEYEHKARQPYLRKLINDLHALRKVKFPEFVPSEKPTIIKQKPEKKLTPRMTTERKPAIVRIQSKRIEKPTSAKKPDVKIEERLQNPYLGTKRNIKFLQEELPAEIKDAYIQNPELSVEWKTIHYCISKTPYFQFTQGNLYYVVTDEDQRETKYAVSEHLIESLWNGTNFLPMDRDIIALFGKISIEDIGSQLKSTATSPKPYTEQSPNLPSHSEIYSHQTLVALR